MDRIDLNQADRGIIQVLRDGRNTPSNIARKLDYTREYVAQRLKRLTEHGVVDRVDRGLYDLAETEGVETAATAERAGDATTDARDREAAETAEQSDAAGETPTTADGVDAPREARDADARDALRDVDFPGGRDREACVDAVLAARDYLAESGGASMREIVVTVMPDHSLGYDVPDLEPGDRYRGSWWRKVVRPGLKALPDVESASGGGQWRVTGTDGGDNA